MLGLFLVLVTAHAGQVCMSNGWVVEWTISDTKIDLSITIDEDTRTNKDWVSVGIETEKLMTDMMVYYIDGIAEDWHTDVQHKEPKSDVSNGGTDDVTGESWDDSKNKFSWSKLLNTGDSRDLSLIEGGNYNLICNSGLVDADGLVEGPYGLKKTLLKEIVLSNDFSSGCTTEVY
ncbi:hypothetical protein SteCoe_20437 [Stentor coeruleus]|uniref:DOMON domain-containing protein n=1 Tax=Stentor coeruleus TaxID=5963 RepID=A0A1R2BS37_9CILI|nr:hypothetical protein SteCoe_20437 [Stentor coeruleus]